MPVAPTPSRHALNRLRAARRHSRAVDATLRRAVTYAHPAGRVVRIETHISVVYLAGRYAYKIMKPVDFGFVDFTQLCARRRCCEAEIRLNQPFAGSVYVDVQPIVPGAGPRRLGRARHSADRAGRGARGDARAVDYAVRMRRFEQRLLYSNLLASGALAADDIDAAARSLAESHRLARRLEPGRAHPLPAAPPRRQRNIAPRRRGARRASPNGSAARRLPGSAALLRKQIVDALAPLEADPRSAGIVRAAALRDWCVRELGRLRAHLDARRSHGFVRACHGDLHLDNIVRRGRHALMFDCIEFSETLRWIDVTCDLAFLLMDLRAHGRPDLANRLLARYLEATGDFAGLAALPLYVVYRALVRAMVALLKTGPAAAGVPGSPYLTLAAHETRERRPWLLLCHGFSGSGKSAASRALADLSGAIRLSSDTERKRAQAFAPPDLRPLAADAYTQTALDTHYARLAHTSAEVLDAGYTALVDATFLKAAHRARFVALARTLGVPVLILNFHAARERLIERVNARARGPRDVSDAGAAVLAAQLDGADPLTPDERAFTVDLNTEGALETFAQLGYWRPLYERIGAADTHGAL